MIKSHCSHLVKCFVRAQVFAVHYKLHFGIDAHFVILISTASDLNNNLLKYRYMTF